MCRFIRVDHLATLVLGIALVASWFARAAEIELSINVAPPSDPPGALVPAA